MILADTSVWIDHLRAGDELLAELLDRGVVLTHPSVVGEVALGNLRGRDEVIGLLRGLPQATLATDADVLRLIEAEEIFGLGIGYVDTQLLAATRLTAGAALWTRNRRLAAAATRLGVAIGPARS